MNSPVETLLASDRDVLHLKSTTKESIPVSYHPDLDITRELDTDHTSCCHQVYYVGPSNLDTWIFATKLQSFHSISHPHMRDILMLCIMFLWRSHIRNSISCLIQKDLQLEESTFDSKDIKASMAGVLWRCGEGTMTAHA